MKIILCFILFFICVSAFAQSFKPFVPGKYNAGNRVSWAGKIYENKAAGNRKVQPPNQYWREVTHEYLLTTAQPPNLTLDSLHRLILSESKQRKAKHDNLAAEIILVRKELSKPRKVIITIDSTSTQ